MCKGWLGGSPVRTAAMLMWVLSAGIRKSTMLLGADAPCPVVFSHFINRYLSPAPWLGCLALGGCVRIGSALHGQEIDHFSTVLLETGC